MRGTGLVDLDRAAAVLSLSGSHRGYVPRRRSDRIPVSASELRCTPGNIKNVVVFLILSSRKVIDFV
jgi:hypothetical protein